VKIRSLAKSAAAHFGYEIRRIGAPPAAAERPSFLLHRFAKPDGSFDYDRYRQLQITANKENIETVWVQEENIAFASNYIRQTIGQPTFGICHGTRSGLEQAWFRRYLGCNVIGTEISDTATQFPNTIQWDFHEVMPEWLNSVDFIYSNAFDHSYDPEKCLNAWMSCVRPSGLCILEHSSLHSPEGVTEVDPFGAEIVAMPYLILTWAKGKYGIRDLLPAPKLPSAYEARYQYLIVIQRH
jgi:hypothetical protein